MIVRGAANVSMDVTQMCMAKEQNYGMEVLLVTRQGGVRSAEHMRYFSVSGLEHCYCWVHLDKIRETFMKLLFAFESIQMAVVCD